MSQIINLKLHSWQPTIKINNRKQKYQIKIKKALIIWSAINNVKILPIAINRTLPQK